jgi:cysteine desulfurase family protein
VIYLDNASTTWPKPEGVAREMQRFLSEDAANPGRGGHKMASRCGRVLEQVRRKLARLVDGGDPERVILCLNCTDALNMAVKGVVSEGDHVIITALEHNSVQRPLQAMANAGRIELTRLPVSARGFVEPEEFARAWKANTRLVVCTHASNVLGTIQPVAEIGRVVHERGGLFLVDAAQTIGLLPVSVARMQIDLLAFPGHKELFGPPGTGGLYVGEGIELRPWREGGTGGDSASPTQPKEYPTWMEAGTPNTVGLAGLNAALDYLGSLEPGRMLEEARALVLPLVEALRDDSRFTVYGPGDTERTVGLVSVNINAVGAEQVCAILDESFDIAARGGLHCAPYTHQALGTAPDGTVRLSVGPFNTADDITHTLEALRQIAENN